MEVVNLHNVVVSAEDLRMPIRLSDQLSGSELAKDVKESMMEMLQGPNTRPALQQHSLYSVSFNSSYRIDIEGADNDFKLTLARMGAAPGQFLKQSFERKLEVRTLYVTLLLLTHTRIITTATIATDTYTYYHSSRIQQEPDISCIIASICNRLCLYI